MESLKIIHNEGSEMPQAFAELDRRSWLHWKTCLRQVVIGFEDIPSPQKFSQFDVLTGQEAYQFFLEVVCGLHSPLLGETEVMGQFKELLEKIDSISILNIRSQMAQFFKSILTDAKLVRETTLKHLGSRTYGSLLRRYLKQTRGVSVLGAGKLANDILPWLKDDIPVNVFCRRNEVAESLRERYDFAQIHLLNSKTELDEMLIIAASVTSFEIAEFMKSRSKNLKKIIDLRDTSSSDPVIFGGILTLSHFFDEIKKAEKEGEERVCQARALIQELVCKRFINSEIRPFGWEDLCG